MRANIFNVLCFVIILRCGKKQCALMVAGFNLCLLKTKESHSLHFMVDLLSTSWNTQSPQVREQAGSMYFLRGELGLQAPNWSRILTQSSMVSAHSTPRLASLAGVAELKGVKVGDLFFRFCLYNRDVGWLELSGIWRRN